MNSSEIKFLSGCFSSKFKLDLLFRGSRDGFTVKEFAKRCRNKGPTLTIVKSDYK